MTTPILVLAALAAVVLAAVHVVTPSLRFLDGSPRSVWLSAAGGVAVAYVFVHFLPDLASGEASVGRMAGGTLGGFSERHVYLIALGGLMAFYGLDRLAKVDRSRRAGIPVTDARGSAPTADVGTGAGVFWIHMASFRLYNGLVGYLLLHRETTGIAPLGFFTVAMALHFVVTDYGLNDDHKAAYRRTGRWVLVAAVVAGFLVGAVTVVSDAAIAALTAFLGGGVILNVLKDEVPSERQSRFWAFALGAAGYSALLLTL
ncbi:hypothetical protein [Methylobacterium pseudosasicola]|uniref:ZIP Zinc transporter n=1 Tax=Methylobacterium pseudosasicola TaxID=582667 RepID=A0A1I4NJV2_9HYPH|nr:hypothetical protein [Methylobacterium pseudosasicola]SFM15443.1 hypothetical protein SAMN05192568_10217 [Methylobacterium pseudosasicola]